MVDSARPSFSVVVPLYNEAANVAPLLARIGAAIEPLSGEFDHEIVLVNDGSNDGTLEAIRSEMARRANIVLVNLSRNFGHQLAATAGLELAGGDAVVLMDGDLQDPPELLEAFLRKWRLGYDVVYAVRRSRKGESRFKLWTARAFYRIIKRLTKVAIPLDTGDFRLMSRRAVEAVRRSRTPSLPARHGQLGRLQPNRAGIRSRRAALGKHEISAPKMLRFAMDGITSFSDVPLRFASYLGFTVSVVAFVYAVVVIVMKTFNLIARVLYAGLGVDDRRRDLSRRRATHEPGDFGRVSRSRLRRSQRTPALSHQRHRTVLIYRPVVDRIAVAAPLDPFFPVLFVAVFAGVALAAARRPSTASVR